MVGQLRIKFPPVRIPGKCPDEYDTVEMEHQMKSYCHVMECWTNCRHGGQCVYEMWGGRPRNYDGLEEIGKW